MFFIVSLVINTIFRVFVNGFLIIIDKTKEQL